MGIGMVATLLGFPFFLSVIWEESGEAMHRDVSVLTTADTGRPSSTLFALRDSGGHKCSDVAWKLRGAQGLNIHRFDLYAWRMFGEGGA